MLKAFLAVLSVFLVSCASINVSQDRLTTVSIQLGEDNVGSGVVIAPGRVLTAKHVSDASENLTINGKPVTVLSEIAESDVSLLRADVECPCAPIASGIKLDETVSIVGYPLQEHFKKQLIKVFGTYIGEAGPRSLFHGFAAPGSSGGGVYNAKSELVGIAVAIPMVAGSWYLPPGLIYSIVYATPLAAIKEVVRLGE